MTSSSREYCFKSPPDEIKEELIKNTLPDGTNEYFQKNIKIDSDCSADSIEVCFNRGRCDINVGDERVTKNGNDLFFYDNEVLMFAAIFSDKDSYDCQTKRLVQRVNSLASLYLNKADNSVCSFQSIKPDLETLKSLTEINPTTDVLVSNIKNKNDLADCKLW